MTGDEIYRIVHSSIPENWRGLQNVGVVQELQDTSYLPDDAPDGTNLFVGGFNLGVCVFDHLLTLAQREPIREGRATIYLSKSNTRSYHHETDEVGACTAEELSEVVQSYFENTGIAILLSP